MSQAAVGLRQSGRRTRRPLAAVRRRLAEWLVAAWVAFDAPPDGRRIRGSIPVFLVGTALSGGLAVYTVTTGWNFAYTDAMAHLTIARRVFDSPHPGIQQLGTVWLPFPHLLLLPFVGSLYLWRTGIAGAIIGALSFGVSSASLFRILARIGVDGVGRAVALLVFWLNPNLLYLSTTALTEPVLIATLLACIAGLVGWATSPRRLSGGELAVFAGLPAAAAVLTRYEGWALTMSGTCYVALHCWRQRLAWRRWVAYLSAFTVPPILAVLAWIAYNYSQYGNPLDFWDGPYSAAQFNIGFRYEGVLQTAGNLGLSTRVFGVSMYEDFGLFPILLAAAGLVVMSLRWGLGQRALTVWLAATSSAFLLFSLWQGQHVIMNAASLPPGDFNNRQTISGLPWIALLAGVLFGMWRGRRLVRGLLVAAVAGGLLWQNLWWKADYYDRSSILAEAIVQSHASAGRTAASLWLHRHYDGGGLLLDETSIASAPQIGIPLRQYYDRDNGAAFQQALHDPARYVRWIMMHVEPGKEDGDVHDDDQVTRAMRKVPQFSAEFAVVFRSGTLEVLRRIGAPAVAR